jgi:hypothetical protein
LLLFFSTRETNRLLRMIRLEFYGILIGRSKVAASDGRPSRQERMGCGAVLESTFMAFICSQPCCGRECESQ